MSEPYSKSLVKAFVDAYIAKSRDMPRTGFTRSDVAAVMFPNTSRKSAKGRLSAAYSAKSERPLTEHAVRAILSACRTVMRRKFVKLNYVDPDDSVAAIERDICSRLRLNPNGLAEPEHFCQSPRLEKATTPADFGVPDLVEWETGSFGFSGSLRRVQAHSLHVLDELMPLLARTDAPQRRLELLRVAVSIALLHQPGSRDHAAAYDRALEAAGHAQLLLYLKGRHQPDSIQYLAARLATELNWASFAPTLGSPTNYMRCLMGNEPLPANDWLSIQDSVEEAVIAAGRRLRIVPSDLSARRDYFSAMSMKARLLLATNDAAGLREADQLYKKSLTVFDAEAAAYGHAYPIFRAVRNAKLKLALTKCECAVAALEQSGQRSSATAFAALFVHLSQLAYGEAPSDKWIRSLAVEAVRCASTCYECSHIFDAEAVRRILFPRLSH